MNVITSVELVIAQEMTKDLTRKWSINELAKAVDKQYRPTHAAVQRLITQGILQKNRNALVEPTYENSFLFEYAERYRAENLSNKELQIIRKKLEEWKATFFLAVLFGSSVHRKGNDVDILFIIPDAQDGEQFRNDLKRHLGSFFSKIDAQIVNEESCYEMLNRPNQMNVMNEVMKNHLVLTGQELFYRMLRAWNHG